MASSLDLSALSSYTIEEAQPIFTAALLGDNSIDLLTKVDGLKGDIKLPKLESTVPAQAGSSCTFNSSGSTTITQTSLTTQVLTVQEEICLYDLEGYFTQAWLPNGTKPDTVQFLNMLIDRKIQKISNNIARTLFQGRSTYTNSTWLQRITSGYLRLIDAAGTAVAATQQASISTSTVRGIVEEIVFQKIPNRVLSANPFLAMDITDFRILLQKLWVDNLYHFMPGSNMMNTNELVYPGSSVKVVGIQGLSSDNDICETGVLPTPSSHRIIAFRKENFLYGFDSEADKNFDVWYDKNTRMLRMYLRLRIGAGIHDITEVVQYTNS